MLTGAHPDSESLGTGSRLRSELSARSGLLRSPSRVMQPEAMGAARLTRYSFSRTMIRRALRCGWRVQRTRIDLDASGHGEAVYTVVAEGVFLHFVAFATTIDEAKHTDRVIAERWEVTAALVEGDLDEALMAMLREQVPLQEDGRFDSRVLVLTRGNRSVRFFDYLVSSLARGQQPEGRKVADAGYIMRSTAFYANGKYGMLSFDGYPPSHPLSAPYRAQMLCAWLFRELAFDIVEHCARVAGGPASTVFDEQWRRYFGLGNATGLGLVPYAFKHPQVIHAWVSIREIALADMRVLAGTPALCTRFESWLERAHRHFREGSNDDCRPFLSPSALAPIVTEIQQAWQRCRHADKPFDSLYLWAESVDHETAELVVSLMLELHNGDDKAIDAMLCVDEHSQWDPAVTVSTMCELIETRFGWLANLDLDSHGADSYWWVISDNTEEPRRVRRHALAPVGRDVAVDIALRIWRLRAELLDWPPDTLMHQVLREHPEHRLAAHRVMSADYCYGEPLDNACSTAYLPLMLQRFQLAMYGMDNFKPKSTDWLRVTLFQGAPRLSDLGTSVTDDWVLPPRPSTAGASVAASV